MECSRCGACCVAPDIAALDKPLGVRCPHLTHDDLCGIYEDRPPICRDYAADSLCLEIAAPTLEERVARYLAHFGLEDEASAAAGATSMRVARKLAGGDGAGEAPRSCGGAPKPALPARAEERVRLGVLP
ncbi:MAG TPA: YkgJ family cysteine cluster protein [Vulgatibacter sp.]